MAIPEIWQRPAVDDINSDSLEYLFAPERKKKIDPPWVKMVSEPEPIARISPEYVRLQTKVEVLAGRLDGVMAQLHDAYVEIGMLKAQLADKNEQLQQMSEYRMHAARAVLTNCENDRLRKRLAALEEIVTDLEAAADAAELGLSADSSAEIDAQAQPQSAVSLPKALTQPYPKAKRGLRLMPITYTLMLVFAWAVLMTVLN